jgi:hypothetical protein
LPCTLQLRGQIHSPYFNSAPICTHVGMAYIARPSQWGGGVHFTCSNDFYLSLLRVKEGGGVSTLCTHPIGLLHGLDLSFFVNLVSESETSEFCVCLPDPSPPPPHPHDNIYLLSFFLI